jgi:hypothetical protein
MNPPARTRTSQVGKLRRLDLRLTLLMAFLIELNQPADYIMLILQNAPHAPKASDSFRAQLPIAGSAFLVAPAP